MSPKTRAIVIIAQQHKKEPGSTVEGVTKDIVKSGGGEEAEVLSIVSQTFAAKIDIETGEHLSDELKAFLRKRYPMRRNAITRMFENFEGVEYSEEAFNTIYFEAKKGVSDRVTYLDYSLMLKSDFIELYDPLKLFLDRNAHLRPTGNILKLVDCFTFTYPEDRENYVEFMTTKWLLGIISTMMGEHSPLMYVLIGPMGIFKTRWFRGLLPLELSSYFGETEFEKGQDDEILMCKKLILLNDEFGGMTRHDVKRFKNLSSKQTFSIREPYGRSHKDMRRLAVLAATSNEEGVLNDDGNRRIIPVHIRKIDFEKYESIDKLQLLIEVYNLYRDGQRHYLEPEDQARLEKHTTRFEDISIERELINKYYTIPESLKGQGVFFYTASDIKVFLEAMTHQRLIKNKISQELKRLGFIQENRKVDGKSVRGYAVISEFHIPNAYYNNKDLVKQN